MTRKYITLRNKSNDTEAIFPNIDPQHNIPEGTISEDKLSDEVKEKLNGGGGNLYQHNIYFYASTLKMVKFSFINNNESEMSSRQVFQHLYDKGVVGENTSLEASGILASSANHVLSVRFRIYNEKYICDAYYYGNNAITSTSVAEDNVLGFKDLVISLS